MNKALEIKEHQCMRCGEHHKRSECTAPEAPFPFNIIGHPTVGFVIGPHAIEIGRPKPESPE